MTQGPDQRSAAAEAMIVSGMAVVIAAGLFEWLVVSPDHPGHALLRVIGSGFAATLTVTLFAAR